MQDLNALQGWSALFIGNTVLDPRELNKRPFCSVRQIKSSFSSTSSTLFFVNYCWCLLFIGCQFYCYCPKLRIRAKRSFTILSLHHQGSRVQGKMLVLLLGDCSRHLVLVSHYSLIPLDKALKAHLTSRVHLSCMKGLQMGVKIWKNKFLWWAEVISFGG